MRAQGCRYHTGAMVQHGRQRAGEPRGRGVGGRIGDVFGGSLLKMIVPGQPDRSELVRRVFTDNEEDLMPPPAAKRPLTPEQKEILKRWIAEGAAFQPHWSFIKPTLPPVPEVRDAAWPRNAIDHFVLARLEQEKLKPSPRADKHTLVRRVFLDLIGFLPTPEEAEVLVNDASRDAYERLVDKLLASPHYGERWARHWLDVVRFAETTGLEVNTPRPPDGPPGKRSSDGCTSTSDHLRAYRRRQRGRGSAIRTPPTSEGRSGQPGT